MKKYSEKALVLSAIVAIAGCTSSKSLLEREQQACRNAMNPSVPPFRTYNGQDEPTPNLNPDPTPPALLPDSMADCMHSWDKDDSRENALTEEEKRKLGL